MSTVFSGHFLLNLVALSGFTTSHPVEAISDGFFALCFVCLGVSDSSDLERLVHVRSLAQLEE